MERFPKSKTLLNQFSRWHLAPHIHMSTPVLQVQGVSISTLQAASIIGAVPRREGSYAAPSGGQEGQGCVMELHWGETVAGGVLKLNTCNIKDVLFLSNTWTWSHGTVASCLSVKTWSVERTMCKVIWKRENKFIHYLKKPYYPAVRRLTLMSPFVPSECAIVTQNPIYIYSNYRK